MPQDVISYEKHPRILLVILVALVAGCQSSAYRAGHLPRELRTQRRATNQTMNLAQIAAPGASDSILAPGDLLEITVATGRDDKKINPVLARVADNGSVDVPIVGPVPVAGLEAFDASQNIVNIAVQRGMYRHPLVTVEIKSKAVNRITVLGAVKEPGVHELPRAGSDLISALAAAGGLNDEAGSEVEIIRQPRFGLAKADTPPASDNLPIAEEASDIQLAAYQQVGQTKAPPTKRQQQAGWQASQTVRLDLANSASTGGIDYRLSDRDIVRIIPRKKEIIHISGLVKNPGQFELPLDQDIRLLDAIALAGGRSSPVADKVFIIRQVEKSEKPLVIQASLSKAKQNGLENLRLGSGDTISVEQTVATAVIDTASKFFRLTFGVASSATF